MAGNIVKWWKHKILGGYKQFSVLQECTTDSEELIYPVRAPSSCSAPPDLLMVSDRETVQLKQSVNIISTSKGHHHQHHSHHNQAQQHQNIPPPHQQQQQQSQYSQHSQNHQSVHHHHNQPKDHHSKKAAAATTAALVNKNHESPLIDIEGGELNGGSGGGGGKNGVDERIRLEEFTCDVSVESGKSSQPLQFSFTFYDLDGHHGKITKDDIAGIVYTIYESIGKSVVVPYCGSKTINVRLTVSPEAKSKSSSSKLKKLSTTVGVGDGGGNDGGGGGGSAPPTGRHQSSSAPRRQHRYRPRKLIKSDEDEDDPDSDSEKDMVKKGSGNSKSHHNHLESKLCCTDDMTKQHSAPTTHQHHHQQQPSTSCKFQPLNITENIYESVSNLKFNGREASRKDEAMLECKECVQSTLAEAVQRHHQQQQQAKHILTRSKLLRRTRKHKDQCVEARQRSLSVGNESSWKIRGVHITKNMNAASNLTAATSTTASTTNATGAPTIVDEVDGVGSNQGGGGGGSNSPNNECWNNALKRNDLIDIIRASMEKNRLCFQGSGKPHHQQNGVSPVRHRQRSHTISKIVNDTSGADIYHQHQSHHHQQQQQPHQQQQQQQHTQHQQTSHHIPIYHQQMAINPAILMSHPKTNLCGYDSFLHATICTPANTSANNSPNSVLVPNHQQHMVSSPTATVPPATKAFINSMKQQHQRSSSKAMRNGGGGVGFHSQQNSPQFHGGYLMEPQKLNSSLLNALNPQITADRKLIRTIDNVEKWLNEKEPLKCSAMTSPTSLKYDEGKLKKDEKNYDNLLYSKLNEKFLDVSTAAVVSSKKILNNNNNNNNSNNNNSSSSSHHHNSQNSALSSNKENERHHHHSHHHNHLPRHSKYNMMSQSGSVSPLGDASSTTTATTAIDRSKFVAPLISIDVDPIECENLIHPNTSDEDSSSLPPATPTKDSGSETKVLNSGRSSNYTAKNVSSRADTINGGTSTSGSCSGASNNGNNSTASTVHRYVHEHIHHHYHHFENNEE